MEWEEINKKAQDLAYEFLKKMGNSHAEDFNPETTMCGIEADSSQYFEDLSEGYCDDYLVKGLQIRILSIPRKKKEDK